MALHLIKLCVGAETLDDLTRWQTKQVRLRRAAGLSPNPVCDTRMTPKRADEILDNGSLFWVIKGLITVRQPVLAITSTGGACEIALGLPAIPVIATPRRPFQGWRYLEPDEAPADLPTGTGDALPSLPPTLIRQLREEGVW
jgi:hypothetical protein